MRRSPALSFLSNLAGRLALALALLFAGLPGPLPLATAHGFSVSADSDRTGDCTILEKRPLPLVLSKPKSGGPRLVKAGSDDRRPAPPASAVSAALPAGIAAATAPAMNGAGSLPWRRHHRLPPNTGPPAA